MLKEDKLKYVLKSYSPHYVENRKQPRKDMYMAKNNSPRSYLWLYKLYVVFQAEDFGSEFFLYQR